MKYYETTKVNQILEAPILSHNNFQEIFEEFDLFKNNDIMILLIQLKLRIKIIQLIMFFYQIIIFIIMKCLLVSEKMK